MIKNLLNDEDEQPPPPDRPNISRRRSEPAVMGLFDSADDPEKQADEPYVLSTTAQNADETVRQSGLAWSLGIAFFSAVVFMLILGWGADLLFGSSPWGVVIGIVIGSLIGFYQLFRLSSQIFKK